MSSNKDEIIKVITTSAMISVLIALARALVVSKEKILVRIRILFASILLGIFSGVLIRTLDISEFKRTAIIAAATAFGHSLWPEVEKLLIKWLKKGDKINDILHNNDN